MAGPSVRDDEDFEPGVGLATRGAEAALELEFCEEGDDDGNNIDFDGRTSSRSSSTPFFDENADDADTRNNDRLSSSSPIFSPPEMH